MSFLIELLQKSPSVSASPDDCESQLYFGFGLFNSVTAAVNER